MSKNRIVTWRCSWRSQLLMLSSYKPESSQQHQWSIFYRKTMLLVDLLVVCIHSAVSREARKKKKNVSVKWCATGWYVRPFSFSSVREEKRMLVNRCIFLMIFEHCSPRERWNSVWSRKKPRWQVVPIRYPPVHRNKVVEKLWMISLHAKIRWKFSSRTVSSQVIRKTDHPHILQFSRICPSKYLSQVNLSLSPLNQLVICTTLAANLALSTVWTIHELYYHRLDQNQEIQINLKQVSFRRVIFG